MGSKATGSRDAGSLGVSVVLYGALWGHGVKGHRVKCRLVMGQRSWGRRVKGHGVTGLGSRGCWGSLWGHLVKGHGVKDHGVMGQRS